MVFKNWVRSHIQPFSICSWERRPEKSLIEEYPCLFIQSSKNALIFPITEKPCCMTGFTGMFPHTSG